MNTPKFCVFSKENNPPVGVRTDFFSALSHNDFVGKSELQGMRYEVLSALVVLLSVPEVAVSSFLGLAGVLPEFLAA